jgi:hypothetical protein
MIRRIGHRVAGWFAGQAQKRNAAKAEIALPAFLRSWLPAQKSRNKGLPMVDMRAGSYEVEVQLLRAHAEHAAKPDKILSALESPDYYLRNEAVHALIAFGHERGWIPAIEAFVKEKGHEPHAIAWAQKALEYLQPAPIQEPSEGMSFPFLPVANGSVSAILDATDGRILKVRDSIFSSPREGERTQDRIAELVFGPADRTIECGYLQDTIGAFRRSESGTTYLLPVLGEKKLEVLVEDDRGWSSATIDLANQGTPKLVPDPSARARLEAYVAGFERWHSGFEDPALDPKDRALYRQMRSCLLMGQAEDGQIVASIPPGHWNISWVRDMSYALVAMSEDGAFEQAKRGLEFLFGRDHQCRYEKEVGVPYQISVVRHYGDGTEEADVEDGSPNIEFDGFGLALWALERYVDRSGDLELAKHHWKTITEKVGDAILSVVDENNGLIGRDSSIWERHLPGRQFTYTSAACERGLRAIADVAAKLGDDGAERRYREAADRLRAAIREHVVGEAILGYASEPLAERTYDASTIEVVNWGLLDLANAKDFDVALATIRAFDQHLAMPDSPGYKRTTDPGWYEEQEWVVLDLRVASALLAMARSPEADRRGLMDELTARADTLIDWVIGHVSKNGGVVPELLGKRTRKFEGAIPMVGYGPGALMLALRDRALTRSLRSP